MEIEFESEDFPSSGQIANGWHSLPVTWDDLLWAAITVGRPSRYFVFRHGVSSRYEALFRLSAVRMTLEQRSPQSRRFRRTAAAKSLDPSEKSAVHYFLGLTPCKLFAEKLLDAPWLLHLDVFRNRLNPTLLAGRSRPDLVGCTRGGDWVAMESKGRVSHPDADCRDKAKEQAERIVAINNTQVRHRIGAVAYFYKDALQFYWRDPQPDKREPRNPMRLNATVDELWQKYYEPVLDLIGSDRGHRMLENREPVALPGADVSIQISPPVLKELLSEQWAEAGRWCVAHRAELHAHEAHSDGIKIIAGESWHRPQREVFG